MMKVRLLGVAVVSVLPFVAPVGAAEGGGAGGTIAQVSGGSALLQLNGTVIPEFVLLWLLASGVLLLFAVASELRHRRRLGSLHPTRSARSMPWRAYPSTPWR